jgi:hypothetical protein
MQISMVMVRSVFWSSEARSVGWATIGVGSELAVIWEGRECLNGSN